MFTMLFEMEFSKVHVNSYLSWKNFLEISTNLVLLFDKNKIFLSDKHFSGWHPTNYF